MKMKKNMLLVCVVGCCCAIAQTNTVTDLVSEMPITFEPLEFQFFRDVNISSSSKEDTDKTTESKETATDSQKTANTAKIEATASAGISHEMTARTFSAKTAAGLTGGGVGGGMIGPIPLGGAFGGILGVGAGAGGTVASSKTQIDLRARLSASASMERSSLSEKELEEIQKIKSVIHDTTTRETKNWKFKVVGRFVNRTTIRYACRDVNDAKIIVQCAGRNIPLKYNGKVLNVLDGDTDKRVEFEGEVTNEDHLALLQWMQENQRLDKQNLTVKIGADFPLHEVSEDRKSDGEQKLAFHSREKNPISVDVRFGDFRDKFPLSVKRFAQAEGRDKRELTVKEVLIAVSEYVYQKNKGDILGCERVFTFDNTGLTRVFGVPVGKVSIGESESSAYKMLMMRIGRKWLSKVDDNVLSTLLNGDEVSRSIVFDEIGDVDIAVNLNEFSEEVKKDYIDQITKLEAKRSKKSKRGQGVLVYLYWNLGNKKKMVEHLASMGKVGLDLTMNGYDGNPLFWQIILEGNVDDANKIVTTDRNMVVAANKQINADGKTILSLIIEKDDLEKYKVLTNAGINTIKDGHAKHLFYAVECGSTNIVHWLVKDANKSNREEVNSCDDKKWTPLMYAVCNGYLDLCKFLVDQGADVNSKAGKEDVMCDDKKNNYPLTRNFIKAMRKLKACQTHWFGEPTYDAEKIRGFLEDGVDVDYRWNFKSHDQWHYSDYGWTFLRWAVENNDARLVCELVKHGSKVSKGLHRNKGMLPLEYAVNKYVRGREGKEDWTVVDELLKADDACITGFRDAFNGLYVAERALDIIKDREKLKKLQVENTIEDCKRRFLGLTTKDDLSAVKKSLPKSAELRNDWLTAAMKQNDCGKKVHKYFLEIKERP